MSLIDDAMAESARLLKENQQLREWAEQLHAERDEWHRQNGLLRGELNAARAELETLRAGFGETETGDERDRAVWCWTRNPHGRLHCGRLAGHEPPHKRGEREWYDAEEGGDDA